MDTTPPAAGAAAAAGAVAAAPPLARWHGVSTATRAGGVRASSSIPVALTLTLGASAGEACAERVAGTNGAAGGVRRWDGPALLLVLRSVSALRTLGDAAWPHGTADTSHSPARPWTGVDGGTMMRAPMREKRQTHKPFARNAWLHTTLSYKTSTT